MTVNEEVGVALLRSRASTLWPRDRRPRRKRMSRGAQVVKNRHDAARANATTTTTTREPNSADDGRRSFLLLIPPWPYPLHPSCQHQHQHPGAIQQPPAQREIVFATTTASDLLTLLQTHPPRPLAQLMTQLQSTSSSSRTKA